MTDRHISPDGRFRSRRGEKADRKLDMTSASSRIRGQVGCWYSSVLTQIKSCCSDTFC